MTSGKSTEARRAPIPASLSMKGKPAVGIHSDPAVESRPDKPVAKHVAIAHVAFLGWGEAPSGLLLEPHPCYPRAA